MFPIEDCNEELVRSLVRRRPQFLNPRTAEDRIRGSNERRLEGSGQRRSK